MSSNFVMDKKTLLKTQIKDKLSTIMLECSLIKTELEEGAEIEEDIRNIEQATQDMGALLDTLVL